MPCSEKLVCRLSLSLQSSFKFATLHWKGFPARWCCSTFNVYICIDYIGYFQTKEAPLVKDRLYRFCWEAWCVCRALLHIVTHIIPETHMGFWSYRNGWQLLLPVAHRWVYTWGRCTWCRPSPTWHRLTHWSYRPTCTCCYVMWVTLTDLQDSGLSKNFLPCRMSLGSQTRVVSWLAAGSN